jgi:hypothetical protein
MKKGFLVIAILLVLLNICLAEAKVIALNIECTPTGAIKFKASYMESRDIYLRSVDLNIIDMKTGNPVNFTWVNHEGERLNAIDSLTLKQTDTDKYIVTEEKFSKGIARINITDPYYMQGNIYEVECKDVKPYKCDLMRLSIDYCYKGKAYFSCVFKGLGAQEIDLYKDLTYKLNEVLVSGISIYDNIPSDVEIKKISADSYMMQLPINSVKNQNLQNTEIIVNGCDKNTYRTSSHKKTTPFLKCNKDSECFDSMICQEGDCVMLNCNDCDYLFGHQCISKCAPSGNEDEEVHCVAGECMYKTIENNSCEQNNSCSIPSVTGKAVFGKNDSNTQIDNNPSNILSLVIAVLVALILGIVIGFYVFSSSKPVEKH